MKNFLKAICIVFGIILAAGYGVMQLAGGGTSMQDRYPNANCSEHIAQMQASGRRTMELTDPTTRDPAKQCQNIATGIPAVNEGIELAEKVASSCVLEGANKTRVEKSITEGKNLLPELTSLLEECQRKGL